MDEVLMSDVESLFERMFEIEHHLFDPAQGSGNLQEIIIDHGEWKINEGINSKPSGHMEDPIEIQEFVGNISSSATFSSTT